MLLLVVSVIPTGPTPAIPHLDKVVHLCEYLLFAWLLVHALPPVAVMGADALRLYRLWAWIYATSYGLLMELLQAMVPWRSADLTDAVMNALGAALGVLIGRNLDRKNT